MAIDNEVLELDKAIKDLEGKRRALLDAKRAGVLKEVIEQIRLYKFTPKELGLDGARSAERQNLTVKREPKYANPVDPTQTWAGGKGIKPKWFNAHLQAGGKAEEMLIKKE